MNARASVAIWVVAVLEAVGGMKTIGAIAIPIETVTVDMTSVDAVASDRCRPIYVTVRTMSAGGHSLTKVCAVD